MCIGCPFGSRFEEELENAISFQPLLYKAANNIFGKSYQYTRHYREYKEDRKKHTRTNKQIDDVDMTYN